MAELWVELVGGTFGMAGRDFFLMRSGGWEFYDEGRRMGCEGADLDRICGLGY